MTKEIIKALIELIPEKDIDVIYRVIVKFIPTAKPELDEVQAILEAKVDNTPTVNHSKINWT